jgi:hypothetical protein
MSAHTAFLVHNQPNPLTRRVDQINCLIILIILVKQRTYLATLPASRGLVRLVRLFRTFLHKNKKDAGERGGVQNNPVVGPDWKGETPPRRGRDRRGRDV